MKCENCVFKRNLSELAICLNPDNVNNSEPELFDKLLKIPADDFGCDKGVERWAEHSAQPCL